MQVFLIRLPFAISGLGLALIATGNLFKFISLPASYLCYFLGILIFLTIFLKLILSWPQTKEDLRSPITASSFATFFMGLQLLSAILHLGTVVWGAAALSFLIYLVWFSWFFALRKDLSLVYPSWVIVYVGIATIAVSGMTYSQQLLSWLSWLLALILYLLVFPAIVLRLYQFPLKNSQRPLLVILAAPTSLLLVAYLSLEGWQRWLAVLLLMLSQVIYIWSLYQISCILMQEFSPLWSALTFPLAISATALKLSILRLKLPVIFRYLSFLESGLVILTVCLILFLYSCFLWSKKQSDVL
ncbi:SLAC1 family transporter [Streptococcus dentapri]|uniref:C4-dicarboxylate transporter/malic acid transport protein n=1 Tax=Streptococcus dentapri TaxID=573564 RepID=A0ABV8CZG0_9STRE